MAGILLLLISRASGADWPQYRGTTGDGAANEVIATTWATNAPGFVVWTNTSITNGFSSLAVAQGRVFALHSRSVGGSMKEVCTAFDAETGTNLWSAVIDSAPWNLNDTGNGGAGTAPYYKGDGPRGTPAFQNGRVFALSSYGMHLVCLNATNGSVMWSNNLVAAYGASTIDWDNGASARVDGDLIFVNLNTATDNRTLAAFRTTDGSRAWATQTESMTHASPIVATMEGVRQVIFPTTTGLVSLECTSGAFLWKYTYPFSAISTSMGASPGVYSNIVYCTASYGRGFAAARIGYAEGVWTATHMYYRDRLINYQSIWMSPVCHEGFIYTLCGNNGSFLTTPLNCIELSTGTLKWSTNGFGMGGLILVNSNLLVLTENGQLVLAQANPNAYTELARYRAFNFTASAPGKCWNSPAYSDGFIYARSTRSGVKVNVAPPRLPALVEAGVTNITTTTATLTGRINPQGTTSGAWFQWGTNTAYGANTPVSGNLTGSAAVPVSHALSGLRPDTAYHFRLVATNSVGVTNGTDLSFTTLPPPSQLELVSPRFLNSTQWLFGVTTTNGAALDASRLARIEVRATNTLGAPPSTWPRITNALVLSPTGVAWMTNLIRAGQPQLFYIALDPP